MNTRNEIAGILRNSDPTDTLLWSDAEMMADALHAAGYRKVDHVEYAADHLHASVLEFQDEDGNLWTDKAAIREYLDQFRNVTLIQRHVTAWEPLA